MMKSMSESAARPLPELSIVIPAYNEELRLADSLAQVCEFCQARFGEPGSRYEILVVDDGSRDDTVVVALGFADFGVRVISLGVNRGKGAAVKQGVLESHGGLVLITDADLSTPIAEFERLRPHLADGALVFGSRAAAGARLTRRQPFHRELMGKTFNKLIRLAGVRGVTDTQCGFKLLDGAVARRLFRLIGTPGFAFDVELAWLAHRLGYPIVEVGVIWENSPSSRVDVLWDPPRMLLEVARFRWRHRALARGAEQAEENLSLSH